MRCHRIRCDYDDDDDDDDDDDVAGVLGKYHEIMTWNDLSKRLSGRFLVFGSSF